MQESQWQKKKKRKRSQSRNNGQLEQNDATSERSNTGSKSHLERLQGIIARLQEGQDSLDLRNDGQAWVKLATQVISSDKCSVEEGCLAGSLVTHLLRHCKSSPDGGLAGAAAKLQMNPQHLLPFAKAVASSIAPSAELHLPNLVMLSQLMAAHSGVCASIRVQLEENLSHWLNYPYTSSGETLAACGNPSVDAAVSLAGDVWALLPIASPAASGDADEGRGARGLRGAGLAAARGKQLQLLTAALQGQLDILLGGVVLLQGSHTSKADSEALHIPPIVAHAAPRSDAPAKSKNKKPPQNKQNLQISEDNAASDDISNPVLLVEVTVHRCCNILVFIERLLKSVGTGANPHGATLAPRVLLGPLVRVLQVSTATLERYSSTEVRRLARLWPRVQRAALTTLDTTITTLDHNLVLWWPELQRVLVAALLAIKPLSPDSRSTAKDRPAGMPVNCSAGKDASTKKLAGKETSAKNFAGKAGKTSAIKDAKVKKFAEKETKNHSAEKNASTNGFAGKDGPATRNSASEVFEVQETVRLIYKCLALLVQVSRGTVSLPLELLKKALQEITVKPSTLVLLQNLSRKSIANMSVKKKSKKKGYTVLPTSNSLSSDGEKVESKVPLSLSLSHGIVYYVLELVESVATSSTAHYTLAVDCAKFLHEQLPKVAAYFISEWRSFPHTLQLSRGGGGQMGLPCGSDGDHQFLWGPGPSMEGCLEQGTSYDAVSGWTDLRCFFVGPLLLGKLVRLLGALGMGGTPHMPPHTTHLLHLLTGASFGLRSCPQLRSAAEGSARPLRFLLSHPRVGDFARTVEDLRGEALNAAASVVENRCEENGGDGAMSDDEYDDEEDKNDGEIDEEDENGDAIDEEDENDGDIDEEEDKNGDAIDDSVDGSVDGEDSFVDDVTDDEKTEKNECAEGINDCREEMEEESLKENGNEKSDSEEMEENDECEEEGNGDQEEMEEEEKFCSKKIKIDGKFEEKENLPSKKPKTEPQFPKQKKMKKAKAKKNQEAISEKPKKKAKKIVKKSKKITKCGSEADESCGPTEEPPAGEGLESLTVEEMLAELAD